MRDLRDDSACDVCGAFVYRNELREAPVVRADGVTFYRWACAPCRRGAA
jgi:hypothetical protein